jgi:hypothetical protein
VSKARGLVKNGGAQHAADAAESDEQVVAYELEDVLRQLVGRLLERAGDAELARGPQAAYELAPAHSGRSALAAR